MAPPEKNAPGRAAAASVDDDDSKNTPSSPGEDWASGWTMWASFHAQHGTGAVPDDHDNPALVRWVKKQREDYYKLKRGEKTFLSADGFQMLTNMGFDWGKDHQEQQEEADEDANEGGGGNNKKKQEQEQDTPDGAATSAGDDHQFQQEDEKKQAAKLTNNEGGSVVDKKLAGARGSKNEEGENNMMEEEDDDHQHQLHEEEDAADEDQEHRYVTRSSSTTPAGLAHRDGGASNKTSNKKATAAKTATTARPAESSPPVARARSPRRVTTRATAATKFATMTTRSGLMLVKPKDEKEAENADKNKKKKKRNQNGSTNRKGPHDQQGKTMCDAQKTGGTTTTRGMEEPPPQQEEEDMVVEVAKKPKPLPTTFSRVTRSTRALLESGEKECTTTKNSDKKVMAAGYAERGRRTRTSSRSEKERTNVSVQDTTSTIIANTEAEEDSTAARLAKNKGGSEGLAIKEEEQGGVSGREEVTIDEQTATLSPPQKKAARATSRDLLVAKKGQEAAATEAEQDKDRDEEEETGSAPPGLDLWEQRYIEVKALQEQKASRRSCKVLFSQEHLAWMYEQQRKIAHYRLTKSSALSQDQLDKLQALDLDSVDLSEAPQQQEWQAKYQELFNYFEQYETLEGVRKSSRLGKLITELRDEYEAFNKKQPSYLDDDRVEVLHALNFPFSQGEAAASKRTRRIENKPEGAANKRRRNRSLRSSEATTSGTYASMEPTGVAHTPENDSRKRKSTPPRAAKRGSVARMPEDDDDTESETEQHFDEERPRKIARRSSTRRSAFKEESPPQEDDKRYRIPVPLAEAEKLKITVEDVEKEFADVMVCEEPLEKNKEAGVTWVQAKSNQIWEERFRQLLAFKKTYGHTLVPKLYQDNKPLAKFVANNRKWKSQRSQGIETPLTDSRMHRLEQIGFVWEAKKSPEFWMIQGRSKQALETWDHHFNDMLDYKSRVGDCLVPKEYPPNQALARWVAKQRALYRDKHQGKYHTLTDEMEARLLEIGFVFNTKNRAVRRFNLLTRYSGRWERMFKKLVAYKKEYGTTAVPRRYKRDKQLGSWAQRQRIQWRLKQAGKYNTLCKYRLEKLQSIDFKFEVGRKQKSQMKNNHEDEIEDIFEISEEKMKIKKALRRRSYGSSTEEEQSEDEEETETEDSEDSDSDNEAEEPGEDHIELKTEACSSGGHDVTVSGQRATETGVGVEPSLAENKETRSEDVCQALPAQKAARTRGVSGMGSLFDKEDMQRGLRNSSRKRRDDDIETKSLGAGEIVNSSIESLELDASQRPTRSTRSARNKISPKKAEEPTSLQKESPRTARNRSPPRHRLARRKAAAPHSADELAVKTPIRQETPRSPVQSPSLDQETPVQVLPVKETPEMKSGLRSRPRRRRDDDIETKSLGAGEIVNSSIESLELDASQRLTRSTRSARNKISPKKGQEPTSLQGESPRTARNRSPPRHRLARRKAAAPHSADELAVKTPVRQETPRPPVQSPSLDQETPVQVLRVKETPQSAVLTLPSKTIPRRSPRLTRSDHRPGQSIEASSTQRKECSLLSKKKQKGRTGGLVRATEPGNAADDPILGEKATPTPMPREAAAKPSSDVGAKTKQVEMQQCRDFPESSGSTEAPRKSLPLETNKTTPGNLQSTKEAANETKASESSPQNATQHDSATGTNEADDVASSARTDAGEPCTAKSKWSCVICKDDFRTFLDVTAHEAECSGFTTMREANWL